MSRVWFITGAGSGIGAGTARAALRAGSRVVATGRDLDKVRAAYRDVESENLALVQLDVADEAQAKAAAEEAVKRFGRIDVLVNKAGYSSSAISRRFPRRDRAPFATTFTAWSI